MHPLYTLKLKKVYTSYQQSIQYDIMMLGEGENINEALENYMHYFNYERPAAALNYLTPVQYKEFCESQKLKLEELKILN